MTDQEFYDDIYIKHYTPLYKYILRKVRDHGLAQNLVQDTLLWAWAKIGDLRKSTPPEKWLYTTAKFLVLKDTRKKYHTEISLADMEYEAVLYDVDANSLDILPVKLRAEDARILKMRYIDHMDYSEMAVELGISVEAIKKRTLRAGQRCREVMEKDRALLIQK